MKNTYLGLILPILAFCIHHRVQAQIDILFVDDSDDTFGNAETFYQAIEDAGYSVAYYDAVSEGNGPTISELESYDLVVWHTSTDGTDLQLWEGSDQDNLDLMSYLDNGGNLWLVGLDFLYDRYGVPSIEFTASDFVYNYLGIWVYTSQSYGNGGEMGVPYVSPAEGVSISGLGDINWSLETLWWVDGVTPTVGADAVYKMSGDESYPLNGQVCALLKHGLDNTVLTYLFDLALATPEDLAQNTSAVLSYFENLVLSTKELPVENADAVYPNPVRTYFRIRSESSAGIKSIQVISSMGEVVAKFTGGYDKYPAYNLGPGVYSILIETENGVKQLRLTKL